MEYSLDYIEFDISSVDGNNRIAVYPQIDKLTDELMKAFEELEPEERQELLELVEQED